MESYIYMKGGIKVSESKTKEKQRQMIIAYYKLNLDVFMERELEVKLTKWQRFILRHMRLRDGKEPR